MDIKNGHNTCNQPIGIDKNTHKPNGSNEDDHDGDDGNKDDHINSDFFMLLMR